MSGFLKMANAVAGPSSGSGADGYVAFFVGSSGNNIAGDNDLYWNRKNNELQASTVNVTDILKIRESDAAPSHIDGYCQIWVRSDPYTALMLSDGYDDRAHHLGCFYAEMFMVTGAATPTITANTWGKIAGITGAGPFRGNWLVGTGNRITWDGPLNLDCLVTITSSVTSSANNIILDLAIAQNGEILNRTIVSRTKATGSDVGGMTIQGLVTMEVSDYIEVWARPSSNSTVTAVHMNVLARTT